MEWKSPLLICACRSSVQGLGFRVGFRVWRLGLRVSGPRTFAIRFELGSGDADSTLAGRATVDPRLVGRPPCDMVASQNRGSIEPKYCNAYYGDPKNGTLSFGKPSHERAVCFSHIGMHTRGPGLLAFRTEKES